MAWAQAAQMGLGAFGNAYQGEAKKNASEYDAKIAEQNAEISRQQSIEEARRMMVVARKQIGEGRANYAASGVSLSGSALDVLGESAANAKLDELTILHEGETRRRMYLSDAHMARLTGEAARVGGYIGASGQLLGGASQGQSAASRNNWKSSGSNLSASSGSANSNAAFAARGSA